MFSHESFCIFNLIFFRLLIFPLQINQLCDANKFEPKFSSYLDEVLKSSYNTINEDDEEKMLKFFNKNLIKQKLLDDFEKLYFEKNYRRNSVRKPYIEKRSLDHIGSSLLDKKSLDHIGSSLLDKKSLDHIGSSLLDKKSLDHNGSSLLDKRSLDHIGSSLLDKRSLDHIGSSLLDKKNLDHIGSSLLDKRSLDHIGSSLLDKKSQDSIKSSLFEKRSLDHIGSSLLDKKSLDHIGSSLLDKKSLDHIGSSLLDKKTIEKKALDHIGSSLLDKRGLDHIGSSLLDKRQYNKEREVYNIRTQYYDTIDKILNQEDNSEYGIKENYISKNQPKESYINKINRNLKHDLEELDEITKQNRQEKYSDETNNGYIHGYTSSRMPKNTQEESYLYNEYE